MAFLADIGIAVASKVAEMLVEPIWRRISYPFKYKGNIRKLKEEVNELTKAKDRVKHRVEEATRSLEEIEDGVSQWLIQVDEFVAEADKVLDDEDTAQNKHCFMGLCPDFKTRYKISRDSEQKTKDCVDLRGKGNFDAISYHPAPEGATLVRLKDYDDFESRTSIWEGLLKALRNPDVSIIGVYGMGGVGKTTLVKKVAAQVKDDRLFGMVLMATVTQNPDLKQIQGKIGDDLEFKFGDAETLSGRANQLHKRLKQEENILIIMDDIWQRIDLEELGIPYGDDHKGCKILMTSRNWNVLSEMGAEENIFHLGVLEDSEAWNLFEKTVGEVINDPIVRNIATDVFKRCSGLPISIDVVGRALKGKDLYAWKEASKQLKMFNHDDIYKQVHSALELSFNFLRGKEIKSLFLHCGQSPLNYVQDLLMKTLGLGMFEGRDTVEEVRSRLYTLLNELKASSLLLEGDNHEIVKLHDVVQNFALSVASRDHHLFAAKRSDELIKWPPQKVFEKCTSICLSYCKIPQLPEILECPNLVSFVLETNDPMLKIPENFFIKTNNLKVLDLTKFHFSSLPPSLKFLQNLRTLCLYSCELEDITVIEELRSLQVLCFWGSKIVQLPKQVGQLSGLCILDLRDCQGLIVIPPNVLSNLTRLEELYMQNSFVKWDFERTNDENKIACLGELKLLTKLSTLEMHVKDAKLLPKGLFPGKLERYKIFIGEGWDWFGEYESSRTLKLKYSSCIDQEEAGIEALLQNVEDLYLEDVVGIGSILYVYELDVQGFPQMKHLHIQNSHDIKYVVNSASMSPYPAFPRLESLFLANLQSMEKICRGQLMAESFTNLRKLEVANCGKVRSLFSFSMAKGFLRLEEIKVIECEKLDGIFSEEIGHDEPIRSTHLRTLKLEYLPQITTLCCKEVKASFTTQTNPNVTGSNVKIVSNSEDCTTLPPLFHDKVVFPNLEILTVSSIKINMIWCSQPTNPSSISKLTTLRIISCNNLKHIFTSSMVEGLGQLKWLEIYSCNLMQEVIATKEFKGKIMTSKIVFTKLVQLKLKSLPILERFCINHLIECPCLQQLIIEDCPQLHAFISNSDNNKNKLEMTESVLFDEKVVLPKLEDIKVCNMPKLKMIWHNKMYGNSFCKLKSLYVRNVQHLLQIFPSYMLRRFQNLENLEVEGCGSLEVVFDLTNQEEKSHITKVTQLRTLTLKYLPNLKCIWNIQVPYEIFNSHNLKSVVILSCNVLKHVFPALIAKCLPQFEKLFIHKCSWLEEIVAKDQEGVEEVVNFVFPKLKSLELRLLPELRSFYHGYHALECPMLEVLDVYHSHKLSTFAVQPFNMQETQQGNNLNFQVHQQPLFSSIKVVQKLEMLSLSGENAALMSQSEFSSNIFNKIKRLHLCCFHDGLEDFPIDLLQHFQNVRWLWVERCYFEGLFPHGSAEGEQYQRTLGGVEHLKLQYLPHLKQIWNQKSPPNQVLLNLSTLSLIECEGLLNVAPSDTFLETLTTLYVRWCHGLINLVTVTTTRSLEHLTTLVVRDCKKVTEIVTHKGDGVENEIIFSTLHKLTLINLESLASFCSGSCTIKFPSLQHVTVERCPNMNVFSGGALSTPKLQRIYLREDRERERWKGNLNTTIQQLYKEEHAQQSQKENEGDESKETEKQ